MEKALFENIQFTIGLTEYKSVGIDWNLKWDKSTYQSNYNRLYYISEGQASLKLTNGSDLVIEPNFIYHIPQNSIIETRCTQAMKQYYIHYSSDSLLYNAFMQSCQKHCIPAGRETKELFRTVVKYTSNCTFSQHLKRHGAFFTILSDFFVDLEFITSINSFSEVLKFIETNYAMDIRISDMATVLNYNTVYFSNKFKKLFSISPQKYLINRRMQKAQELLITTTLPVQEIAYKSGFLNTNYFNECFKSYYIHSPSNYRKTYNLTSEN